MKLIIDTTSPEKIILKIDKSEYQTNARHEKSQRLLPFLMEVLEKEKKKLLDIKSIEFMQGKGSFTGIRVAASIANTLGYLFDIPVNGRKLKDSIAKLDYNS